MIDELALLLLSLVVLAAAAIERPARATCPRGWVHEGIRRSGDFACHRSLVGGEDDAPGEAFTGYQPPGELAGRLYCADGTIPLAPGPSSVRCGRGRYQW